jgi:hypothetical protein
MVGHRIVRWSGPSSARVLRYVYDCVCGTCDYSLGDTDCAIIVPAANITDIRRVCGFTLKLTAGTLIMYVLVYVPEGINPDGIALNIWDPTIVISLYTPE